MFSAYRNSLKNNLNNNSNGYADQIYTCNNSIGGDPTKQQGVNASPHLYQTTRNGGFF